MAFFRKGEHEGSNASVFDQQFYNRIETAEGVSYVRILPDTPISDDPPYFAIVSGMSEGPHDWHDAVEHLSSAGFPVLFLSRSPRKRQPVLTETNASEVDIQTAALFSMLSDNPTARNVHTLGHSFGALVALNAALIQDESASTYEIKEATIISPPTGDELGTLVFDYFKMIGRQGREKGVTGIIQSAHPLGRILEAVPHVIYDAPGVLGQLKAVSGAPIAEMVQKADAAGVMVHAYAASDDRMFSALKVQERLGTVDVVPGNHSLKSIYTAGCFQLIADRQKATLIQSTALSTA